MQDMQFIRRMQERIEESAGRAIDLEISEEDAAEIEVELAGERPRVVIGADALKYPGLARMFMQYAILCLRQERRVPTFEFLLFLRRN